MMPVNVTTWLRGLGLEQYAAAFLENEIDERSLPSLTAEDLRDLGVTTVGHRRRLLDAIAALRAETSGANVAETSGADVKVKPPPATLQQPDLGTRAAERRPLTVMACEILGSASPSTQIDPEELGDLINAYHKVVAETVVSFGGFVAQSAGDGVLIYFGYPQANDDDAEGAVRAGLAVIHATANLSGSVTLPVRIGIATGIVVVDDLIDAGGSQELGVVAATPNLAARVLTLAEPNTIVIAEGTRHRVGGLFELEDLGPQELEGFGAAQHAWRVLGESAVASRFELRPGETPIRHRQGHRRRHRHRSRPSSWYLLIMAGLIVGTLPLLWLVFSKFETRTQTDTMTKIAGNASAPAQKSTQRDTQSGALEQKSTQNDTQAARKDAETRMGRVYEKDFENAAVNRTASNPLSKQVPVDYKLTAEEVFASRNKGDAQLLGPIFNIGSESCKDCLPAEALSESERLRYFGLVRIHRMAALVLYSNSCSDRLSGDKAEALTIIGNQFKKLPREIQEEVFDHQIKAIQSRPALYYTNGELVAPGGIEWFCRKTSDAINSGDTDPMFKTARGGFFPIGGN